MSSSVMIKFSCWLVDISSNLIFKKSMSCQKDLHFLKLTKSTENVFTQTWSTVLPYYCVVICYHNMYTIRKHDVISRWHLLIIIWLKNIIFYNNLKRIIQNNNNILAIFESCHKNFFLNIDIRLVYPKKSATGFLLPLRNDF